MDRVCIRCDRQRVLTSDQDLGVSIRCTVPKGSGQSSHSIYTHPSLARHALRPASHRQVSSIRLLEDYRSCQRLTRPRARRSGCQACGNTDVETAQIPETVILTRWCCGRSQPTSGPDGWYNRVPSSRTTCATHVPLSARCGRATSPTHGRRACTQSHFAAKRPPFPQAQPPLRMLAQRNLFK